MNNENIIKKVFTDPRTGFKSIQNTYKTIKELFPDIKIKKREVEEFIKNQSSHQVHTIQKINPKDYNQITAQQLGFCQIDFIDMSNYKRHNENYRFILLAVDIKSRFGMMEKLKLKQQKKFLCILKTSILL